MANWWFLGSECDTCCDYAKATLCSGQSTTDAPVVYVHKDNLPVSGTKYFRVARLCYSISYNAPLGMIERESAYLIKANLDGTSFSTCSDCVDYSEPSDGGSGNGIDYRNYEVGGAGANGAGWSGGYFPIGGGGGGTGESYQPPYLLATRCDPSNDGAPERPPIYVEKWWSHSTTMYFPYFGVCYSINPSNETTLRENLPENRITLRVTRGFTLSCEDCRAGRKIQLCPGQTEQWGYAALNKELYLPKNGGAPAGIRNFQHNGFCWHHDPTVAWTPMPYGAETIFYIPNEYVDCDHCGIGVQAVPCEGQPNIESAPIIWVRAEYAPQSAEEDDLVFRYEHWCYRVAYQEAWDIIPSYAFQVVPANLYPGCAECICGVPEIEYGWRVRTCDGYVRERVWWIKESTINNFFGNVPRWGAIYFKDPDGYCSVLYPNSQSEIIPLGAALMSFPAMIYASCWSCIISDWGWPPPLPKPDPDEPDEPDPPVPPEPEPDEPEPEPLPPEPEPPPEPIPDPEPDDPEPDPIDPPPPPPIPNPPPVPPPPPWEPDTDPDVPPVPPMKYLKCYRCDTGAYFGWVSDRLYQGGEVMQISESVCVIVGRGSFYTQPSGGPVSGAVVEDCDVCNKNWFIVDTSICSGTCCDEGGVSDPFWITGELPESPSGIYEVSGIGCGEIEASEPGTEESPRTATPKDDCCDCCQCVMFGDCCWSAGTAAQVTLTIDGVSGSASGSLTLRDCGNCQTDPYIPFYGVITGEFTQDGDTYVCDFDAGLGFVEVGGQRRWQLYKALPDTCGNSPLAGGDRGDQLSPYWVGQPMSIGDCDGGLANKFNTGGIIQISTPTGCGGL